MAEKEVTVEPQVETKKKVKMVWTLEKCKKIASRFTTREEWIHGAPSAFKAATARGWDVECCAHMTNLKPMKTPVAAKGKPALKTTKTTKTTKEGGGRKSA
jgi:hypothetical protein